MGDNVKKQCTERILRAAQNVCIHTDIIIQNGGYDH
jgi:hypothetical protein